MALLAELAAPDAIPLKTAKNPIPGRKWLMEKGAIRFFGGNGAIWCSFGSRSLTANGRQPTRMDWEGN